MNKLLKLRELLKKKTGKVLYSCPFIAIANKFKYKYHSKTHIADLIAFMSDEINELAIVNAGGTGITYENLQYLVIQQASSDKNGQSTQKICRALLKQTNIVPEIYILCLLGTQDEIWVQKTLENFDQSKIREINV